MWVYRESTSPMTQFRSWEAHTRISHRGSVRSDTDRRDEPGDTDGHSCPSSERVGSRCSRRRRWINCLANTATTRTIAPALVPAFQHTALHSFDALSREIV